MNSSHEAWTEIWGTSGVADLIDSLALLDADIKAKLVANIAYAACNSYTTGSMDLELLSALKTAILMHTTATD